jgi:hypothetical protein
VVEDPDYARSLGKEKWMGESGGKMRGAGGKADRLYPACWTLRWRVLTGSEDELKNKRTTPN